MVPTTELEARIQAAIDEARVEGSSRELSLVITKLEEALMWAERDRRNTPNR